MTDQSEDEFNHDDLVENKVLIVTVNVNVHANTPCILVFMHADMWLFFHSGKQCSKCPSIYYFFKCLLSKIPRKCMLSMLTMNDTFCTISMYIHFIQFTQW